jgi:hypothetical protein
MQLAENYLRMLLLASVFWRESESLRVWRGFRIFFMGALGVWQVWLRASGRPRAGGEKPLFQRRKGGEGG